MVFERHWDPRGPQSHLIPVLRLETESLSRTFSSLRTATHPPLGQELSQRRFRRSRANYLLSSHPCWMVLAQGEQSIPIIGAIVDGCPDFAFATGLLDISLGNVSFSRTPFALCVHVLSISIGESICSFCVTSCIGAGGLENGDGDGSCCITTVGCWSSTVFFLQLIQLLLRPFSNSRFLSHQPAFYAIAPDMLPCEISIGHSRCIQVLLQSSSRSWLSDAYADVQIHLDPGAFQSLTSNSLPRLTNFSLGVTRCNDFAFWTPFCQITVHSMAPSLIQIACWHGSVLVHHSFSEWQVTRVSLSRNTQKCVFPVVLHLKLHQAPRSVTNRPGQRNAVI